MAVFVVTYYNWDSWKSFRSLNSVAFTTKEAAELFMKKHEHIDNDQWYFELFELEPYDAKNEKEKKEDDTNKSEDYEENEKYRDYDYKNKRQHC
jgi:hypothetical protein